MAERMGARVAMLVPLAASGMLMVGCVSSPTYGTDKTSTEQLVTDVSGILSMGPKPKPKIDYEPRPELVRPASTAALPAPQENIVAADSAAWPESPEQQRARVREYATENRDKQGYEPLVISDVPASQVTSQAPGKPGESARAYDSGIRESVTKQQTAAYKQAAAASRQGDATERKYLSEPPLIYRQPEATAPVGELGEEEVKKERRKRREAQKADSSGLTSWIPDIFD